MERLIALFALAFAALALPGHAVAQDAMSARTIATERWVEEWDPASQRWVRVSESPSEAIAKGQVTSVTKTHIINGVVVEQSQTAMPAQQARTFAVPSVRPKAVQNAGQSSGEGWGQRVAQYGPFRVLDDKRAAIVGSTDQRSPALFNAMLRDFPDLEVLELVEAPGTRHDIANLKVGRMIRAAGLRTHVPTGGSVRSGAVELFLAGATQTMDQGAQFAVHSWLDAYGRQPQDFPEDHPANRLYLDYYIEMGMSERQARDFYAMTNSVPHSGALWLTDKDMRPWVDGSRSSVPAQRLAQIDAPHLPVSFEITGSLDLALVEVDQSVALASVPAPSIAYADMTGLSLAMAM